MTAVLASSGEIGVFLAAAFILFRRSGHTTAEAAAYAVVAVFMAFSFLLQVAFLVGLPPISIAAEAVIFLLALRLLWEKREVLGKSWGDLRRAVSMQPFAAVVLGAACAYLAFEAATSPPDPSRWPSVERMLAVHRHQTLFFTAEGGGEAEGLAPLNAQVLPYLFLRWHTGRGAGLIGFLAYACIGFSTYALARRHAWPQTSWCVAAVVMSFPRFVHHAVSPGDEIVPAAVAVFCVLAMYRVVERLRTSDLILLVLGIFFQISGTAVTLVLPLVLTVLAFVMSYHRHGMFSWRRFTLQKRTPAVLGLIPALLFSQVWLFAVNIFNNHPWAGHLDLEFNPDGLLGAVANVCRYLLEAVRLPGPMEELLSALFGGGWTDVLMRLHDAFIGPFFGTQGAALSFTLSKSADAMTEWFGPFGFLLLWPALFSAVFLGPRRLKAVSVALLAYVYAVALILAWRPQNASHFSAFYACGGFCIAFLLPPWRLTSKGMMAIQIASALLIAVTCFRI